MRKGRDPQGPQPTQIHIYIYIYIYKGKQRERENIHTDPYNSGSSFKVPNAHTQNRPSLQVPTFCRLAQQLFRVANHNILMHLHPHTLSPCFRGVSIKAIAKQGSSSKTVKVTTSILAYATVSICSRRWHVLEKLPYASICCHMGAMQAYASIF